MEKTNIAELLKDCPSGMELDCAIWDNVEFDRVDMISSYPIFIRIKGEGCERLTEYGQWSRCSNAKCVIFPKGKTTWEGFHRPFKEGDVIVSEKGDIHLLRTSNSSYCAFRERWKNKLDRSISTSVHVARFATEEEKQRLFNAIKDKGYKWNAETRTLEKLIEPKFKVGDRIKYKNGVNKKSVKEGIILSITDDTYDVAVTNDMGIFIPIAEQDDWEVVPNKFDITTLKPFESKVLVRHNNDNKWCASFFSHIDEDFHSHCYKFVTVAGKSYPKMIPYEGNEHLLGKTDDCDEFFKTWEK